MTRNRAHTSVLFRSPDFYVNSSGDLTFYLSGGEGNGNGQGTAPANESAIGAATGGAGVHWQGVALRSVATGNYLLSGQKTTEGDAWQQITFSAASLAPFIGQQVSLDFIDSRQGNWGWNQLDTVVIPGSLHIPVHLILNRSNPGTGPRNPATLVRLATMNLLRTSPASSA